MTSDQVFEVETQALTFRGGSTKSAWDRRGSELPHEVEKDLTPPPQPRAPTLASNYSRASARRRSFQYLRTHAFLPFQRPERSRPRHVRYRERRPHMATQRG